MKKILKLCASALTLILISHCGGESRQPPTSKVDELLAKSRLIARNHLSYREISSLTERCLREKVVNQVFYHFFDDIGGSAYSFQDLTLLNGEFNLLGSIFSLELDQKNNFAFENSWVSDNSGTRNAVFSFKKNGILGSATVNVDFIPVIFFKSSKSDEILRKSINSPVPSEVPMEIRFYRPVELTTSMTVVHDDSHAVSSLSLDLTAAISCFESTLGSK